MSDGRGRDGRGGRDDDARAHARIEGALRQLGAELTAPAGWQERVLAAIAEEERAAARGAEPAAAAVSAEPAAASAAQVQGSSAAQVQEAATKLAADVEGPAEPPPDSAQGPRAHAPRPSSAQERRARTRARRWWTVTVPVAAAAALAAVALWRMWPADRLPPLRSAVAVKVREGSGGQLRSARDPHEIRAQLGDTIIGEATGAGRYQAVWIFRGDELVACTDPGCPGRDSDTDTRHVVKRVGTYKVIALASNEPLPAPVPTSLDRSLAAVIAQRVEPDVARVIVE